jgi:hypothetical protein
MAELQPYGDGQSNRLNEGSLEEGHGRKISGPQILLEELCKVCDSTHVFSILEGVSPL